MRKKSEVLKAQENAMVGCCERFAEYKACNCLEEAEPDCTLVEAFQKLAEAANGRWDGVDAVQYVNDLRRGNVTMSDFVGMNECSNCGALYPHHTSHTCPYRPAETFPRGPSNEQTLLTELGQCKAERDAWEGCCDAAIAERDEAKRQLAEIKEIDAKMCADYSTMVEQLAEVSAERDALADQLKAAQGRITELMSGHDPMTTCDDCGAIMTPDCECSVCHAPIAFPEPDALAVTATRQAEQIRRLREALCFALEEWSPGYTEEFNLSDDDKAKLAAARAALKETAPND